MLVKEIGEFGLIERFRKAIKTDASVIKGPGDDCAVLAFDKSRYQLFTCDMIVEGIDFTLQDDPFLIGRKALAIQVSDIAACAGIPRHFRSRRPFRGSPARTGTPPGTGPPPTP